MPLLISTRYTTASQGDVPHVTVVRITNLFVFSRSAAVTTVFGNVTVCGTVRLSPEYGFQPMKVMDVFVASVGTNEYTMVVVSCASTRQHQSTPSLCSSYISKALTHLAAS